MAATEQVTFTGAAGEQFALVLDGDPHGTGTLQLLVWQGTEGWTEKHDVPHGKAGDGLTWH